MYFFFKKKKSTQIVKIDNPFSFMKNIYKNPSVWNESVWMFLYCVGSTCPSKPTQKDLKYYKLFIDNFYHVIPCDICKHYFKTFLDKNNICNSIKQNRLLHFMIRLRNDVMKNYEESDKVKISDVRKDLSTKCFQETKPMTIKNPKIWGNHAWLFLHCSSFNYPKQPTIDDKKHYHDFLISLQHVLPCKLCRNHLKEYMEKNPIDEFLNNRNLYIKYVIQLHNHVNEQYNKKQRITFRQAKQSILQNCFEQFEKKKLVG